MTPIRPLTSHQLQFLKTLPKIEVSFQDDFSGSDRELYLTPSYVLRQLGEMRVQPRIGMSILFWEKDSLSDGTEQYICNVGHIVEAAPDNLQDYEE